jgi:hypothetical protein
MSATKRHYLFGLIFIGIGIYQLTIRDYLEFSLYATAGLSFVVNALTLEPKFAPHKKILVPLSWVLIISTGLLLLYLVQFKWF